MAKFDLLLGDVPAEPGEHVVDNVGIGILVDRDGSRCMRTVHDADPMEDTCAMKHFVNALGNFHELVAQARADFKRFHDQVPFRLEWMVTSLVKGMRNHAGAAISASAHWHGRWFRLD